MRGVDVVAQRATILRLAEQDQRPGEIARQIGCSDPTVRAALRVGAAIDRRSLPRGRTAPAVVATIAELAAEGRACGDIVELVVAAHGPGAANEDVVARLARRYRRPAPPATRVGEEDLAAAAAAAPNTLAPEIALRRTYLRWLAERIADPRQARRRRAQLIRQSALTIETLVRAIRASRRSETRGGREREPDPPNPTTPVGRLP
jgi:hypothetical protein